ncbi:apoptosis regulator BAX-like [Talpa occidentalis]|uniref:apoptosis regulator BAX-like n=1 Tax=Talpa occidentalis TaxID=50954 RepID=UPI00188E0B37|nr:apoptosis regulator BAX-like [Talpa occidentalis]
MDGSGEQCRGGGPTSSEQIMETAGVLLRRFICDQIGPATKYVAQLALEQVAQDPHIKELVKVLKRKAKEVHKDKKLQRLLETLRGFTAGKFYEVARQIFSDGISWGKIVTLFCFASKLVLKALDSMRELITSIMDWTLDFIRKRLLPWIQEQGGWDGLLSRYSNHIKWLAVAMAIIAVAVAIIAVAVDFTPKQQLHWPWSWIAELAGWDGLLSQQSNQIKWLSVAVAIMAVTVATIAVAVDFIREQKLPGT